MQAAFLKYGCEHLGMSGLAQACGLSRRALYNYFPNRDEAFRAMFRLGSEGGIVAGLAAAQAAMQAGGGPVEVLSAAVVERFGFPRRLLNASVHATEINDEAFRLCKDIIVEVRERFHADLVRLIEDLQVRGRLKLRADISPSLLAEFLADAARGIGQSVPLVSDAEMPDRYGRLCAVIVRGCAQPSAQHREAA